MRDYRCVTETRTTRFGEMNFILGSCGRVARRRIANVNSHLTLVPTALRYASCRVLVGGPTLGVCLSAVFCCFPLCLPEWFKRRKCPSIGIQEWRRSAGKVVVYFV